MAWQAGEQLQVIYDEIHKAKNWKRWERTVTDHGKVKWALAKNISGSAARLSRHCGKRLGLSATPAPNLLADLYSALDLLEPGCWGTGLEWKVRYCAAKQNKWGGWDAKGRSNTSELQERLKWVIHKVGADIVRRSMPPLRRQLCYLSRKDQTRATGFKAEFKRAAKKGVQALFEIKLLEACSRKRKWIIEMVLEASLAGQKVVVLTGRRKDCEQLAASIEKKLTKHAIPVWWGHGGVSTVERHEMVEAYAKHTGACCFVGTTHAFGEAYDGFQFTDLDIIALLPDTPGKAQQTEGRFARWVEIVLCLSCTQSARVQSMSL